MNFCVQRLGQGSAGILRIGEDICAVTLNKIISLVSQIILQARVGSAKAAVAIDDISITKACEATNHSLSNSSMEGKDKETFPYPLGRKDCGSVLEYLLCMWQVPNSVLITSVLKDETVGDMKNLFPCLTKISDEGSFVSLRYY